MFIHDSPFSFAKNRRLPQEQIQQATKNMKLVPTKSSQDIGEDAVTLLPEDSEDMVGQVARCFCSFLFPCPAVAMHRTASRCIATHETKC